ncbi:MAG: acetylxylan esterase [Verrucomicrobiales bacterium]|nr:acetylxylan esterase [Verrucomicrobiales bacterium]
MIDSSPPPSRREILGLGIPAIAGGAAVRIGGSDSHAAEAKLEGGVGASWPVRRRKIERKWLEILGDFPTEIPDLKVEMKEAPWDEEGITRYHVSYQSESDDRVTAWLLVPDAAGGKPTPAIICIHSTTWGSGKDQVIGLSGKRPVDPAPDPQIGVDYGLTHARHGFITLSIDVITDGERIEPKRRVMDTRVFYKKHPEWSVIGKTIWDCSRGVDFLQSLDFVDYDQIGVTGLSLGGHMAIFVAAFEPRISATVANGGVLDMHRHTDAFSRVPKDNNWEPWEEGVDEPTNSAKLEKRFGFKTNSGPFIYLKNFRKYVDDQSLPLPVNIDDLMMLVAPRPMLVISTEQEFYRHKFFEKAPKVLDVYINWQDVDGLPSVLTARKERLGWDDTVAYYDSNHNIGEEKLTRQFGGFGAGDCFSWFSFPGRHGLPGVARRMSFAWFDRWLGRTLY